VNQAKIKKAKKIEKKKEAQKKKDKNDKDEKDKKDNENDKNKENEKERNKKKEHREGNAPPPRHAFVSSGAFAIAPQSWTWGVAALFAVFIPFMSSFLF